MLSNIFHDLVFESEKIIFQQRNFFSSKESALWPFIAAVCVSDDDPLKYGLNLKFTRQNRNYCAMMAALHDELVLGSC